ncbi:inositol monophosphatase family protein [Lentisphaerota bacterium WC36G]|nr:inositol monophosphatase [Lentisphaerae bacterium WC36]
MKLSSKELQVLTQIAINAATSAGEAINRYDCKDLVVQNKYGKTSLASQVVTEVDILSQKIILEILKPTLKEYDLAVLAEESSDDKQRLENDFFWCIDPLDGTLPFINQKAGYAVSIALVSREGVPFIGVVFDPLTKILYHAIKGQGVFRNNESWFINADSEVKQLTITTDYSLINSDNFKSFCKKLEKIAIKLGYDELNILDAGGAVMNALWVLEQSPGCYVKYPKPKGGSLWDYAATAAIYQEFGAVACDIYGSPLELNRPDSTYMNHNGIIFANDDKIAQAIVVKR